MACATASEEHISEGENNVVLFHNGIDDDVDDQEEQQVPEEQTIAVVEWPVAASSIQEEQPVVVEEHPVAASSSQTKIPPATHFRTTAFINPFRYGAPLAVSLLSTTDTISRIKDTSAILPPIFATYTGPGGECVRTFLHSVIADIKATANYKYPTHATIKFALFVGFIDLCCAFTPTPTEEICNIIVKTATSFMDNIRKLFATDVYEPINKFTSTTHSASVEDQIDATRTIFPEKYDTRVFVNDPEVPLEWTLPDVPSFGSGLVYIFDILHEYAENRDTVFYAYAQYVRTQGSHAFNRRQLFIANIFIRYFVYAVTAVSRLIPCNWQYAIKNTVDGDKLFAAEALKNKIATVLHINFVDISTYMMTESHEYESRISAEFNRYDDYKSKKGRRELALVAAEHDAKKYVKAFRPQMDIPVDEQPQGSSCAIL